MIWLITGGTEGIGKALYENVITKGNKAVICSRGISNNPDHVQVDVSDPEQVKKLIENVVTTHKRIDVLVNNAGVYRRGMIEDISIESWNECIDTNLNGTFHMCKYVLPHMREHNFGRIINVSSYVAYYSPTGRAAYNCSKLAVLGLTETLAKEVELYDIKVNAFSPKKTSTRMDLDNTAEKQPEEVAEQIYELHKCNNTGRYFMDGEEVEWRLQ